MKYVTAAGLILGLGIFYVIRSVTAEPGRDLAFFSEALESGTETFDTTESFVRPTVICYITGAVKSPGVYELSGEERIIALVEKAGGVLPDADTASCNMAEPVTDGLHIHIPVKGDIYEYVPDASGKVNINTADLKTLQSLPGIGETKAKAILDYRKSHERFQKIEDIKKVQGIGDGLFNQIKELIKV